MRSKAPKISDRRQQLYELAQLEPTDQVVEANWSKKLTPPQITSIDKLFPAWDGAVHSRRTTFNKVTTNNKVFDRLIMTNIASQFAWRSDLIEDIFPSLMPVRALSVNVGAGCVALSLAMRGPSTPPNFGDFLAMDMAEDHIAENIIL